MGYILAAKWFLSLSFFWCNYSQRTSSSSFFRHSGWWDLQAGLLCVGRFNMHAHAFYFLCVKQAYNTRWFQYIKTHRLCASCLIILITLPSSDAQIPNSKNKHHSQINSQTSLKQHLPLTTSAHQLKGSHRRSIKIDSLLGRRVSKHTAFSFTTDGTDTSKMEGAQRCWAASVSTKLLLWCLIRNSGLTTANQPAAMQRPLTGEAAITSAAEWSACYITSQAWPQSEQRGCEID